MTLAATFTVTVAGWDDAASSLRLGAQSGTQTLEFLPNCDQDADLTLNARSVIGRHGVVELAPATGCTANSVFTQSSGALINNGLIHALAGAPGIDELQVHLVNNGDLQLDSTAGSYGKRWVNNGTIEIAAGVRASVEASDTALVNHGEINATGSGSIVVSRSAYVQAEGTTTGATPIIVLDGQVRYTGDGKSTVVALGRPTTVTGDLGPRQTLVIEPTCDEAWATVDATADWTNRGKVVLKQNCGGNAELEGAVTLTNLGTIQTKGAVTLDENLINEGMVTIAPNSIVETYQAQVTNTPGATLSIGIASNRKFGRIFDANLQLDGVSPKPSDVYTTL